MFRLLCGRHPEMALAIRSACFSEADWWARSPVTGRPARPAARMGAPGPRQGDGAALQLHHRHRHAGQLERSL